MFAEFARALLLRFGAVNLTPFHILHNPPVGGSRS